MKDMSSVTNYLDMDNKELFNIYSQDKSNKEVRDILIERNLYLVNIFNYEDTKIDMTTIYNGTSKINKLKIKLKTTMTIYL